MSQDVKLFYCEDNVLHVYDRYREMITRGKEKDRSLSFTALKQDYDFLEYKKKQITPKSVQKNGWKSIREDTFNALIGLLQDKGWLEISDNRLVYQKTEGLFHALEYHYNDIHSSSMDYGIFAGEYRSFNIALMNRNTIIKGNLNIEYHPNENYLSAVHNVSFDNKFQKEFIYTGTVTVINGKNHLILKAANEDIFEEIRLQIIREDEKTIIMEGIASLYSMSQKLYVIRRTIIDNLIDAEPFPELKNTTFSIQSNKLPEQYQDYINGEDNNYFKMKMISGLIK
ncbi:MAG: hypothetical protein AAF621_05050 [Pseudomonadota bacterium]